jgi:hypothetical protein
MSSSGNAGTLVAITRPGVALTLLAVMVSGSMVARQGRPVFWSITLLVAMIVVVGATRSGGHARERLSHLPSALRQLITETLAALPSGEAATQLSGIARLADAVLAVPERDFDRRADTDLEQRVVDLVEACCDTSRGLGRIDSAWPKGLESTVHGVSDTIASARAAYVRQLQDASATLERLTASVAQRDARASQRVSELAADIRREIVVREDAIRELDRLLSP